MKRSSWSNRELLIVIVVVAAIAAFLGYGYGRSTACSQFFSWGDDPKNGSAVAYDGLYRSVCGS